MTSCIPNVWCWKTVCLTHVDVAASIDLPCLYSILALFHVFCWPSPTTVTDCMCVSYNHPVLQGGHDQGFFSAVRAMLIPYHGSVCMTVWELKQLYVIFIIELFLLFISTLWRWNPVKAHYMYIYGYTNDRDMQRLLQLCFVIHALSLLYEQPNIISAYGCDYNYL